MYYEIHTKLLAICEFNCIFATSKKGFARCKSAHPPKILSVSNIIVILN